MNGHLLWFFHKYMLLNCRQGNSGQIEFLLTFLLVCFNMIPSIFRHQPWIDSHDIFHIHRQKCCWMGKLISIWQFPLKICLFFLWTPSEKWNNVKKNFRVKRLVYNLVKMLQNQGQINSQKQLQIGFDFLYCCLADVWRLDGNSKTFET